MVDCKVLKDIKTKKELKKYIHSIKQKTVKSKSASRTRKARFSTAASSVNSFMIKLFTNKHDSTKGTSARNERKKVLESIKKDMIDGISGTNIVPEIWSKIKGLETMNMNDTTLFDFKNEEVDAISIIQRGLAFDHILSSVKSEFDLMDKHNLSEAEVRMLIPPGQVIPGVSAVGNLAAIGREIAFTQDMAFAPNKKAAGTFKDKQADVERIYTQIGYKAVKQLEALGMVKIEFVGEQDAQGNIVNRDFKTFNGDQYKKNAGVIQSVVLRINVEALTGNLDKRPLTSSEKGQLKLYLQQDLSAEERGYVEENFVNLAANMKAARALKNLVVPSNLVMPDTEYTETIDAERTLEEDVKTDKTTRETLNLKEQGSLYFDDSLKPLTDYIYERMQSSTGGQTFKQAAKSIFNNNYRRIFGFTEEGLASRATRDSERGKALSKTVPTTDFFENYTDLKDADLHLHEIVKKNGRGHYDNTVLNPQTDKNFSRYVLKTKPYTFNGFDANGNLTPTMAHLVAGVLDQGSNITVDSILHAGINSELDKLLYRYEKGLTSGKLMAAFMKYTLDGKGFDVGGGTFQQLDTLSAIKSIRDAVSSKDGKLTGNFMVKPDGTASGAVIMSMQLAGKYPNEAGKYNTKDNDLFRALGLDSLTGKEDAYKFVEDELRDIEKTQPESELGKTMKFLFDNDVFKDFREFAKAPSMTVMYSQGEPSSIQTVADEITAPVFKMLERSSGNPKILKQVKEWIQISNPELYADIKNGDLKELLRDKHSKKVYDGIHKYMTTKVTNEIYNVVVSEFSSKFLNENTAFVKEIFSNIEIDTEKTKQRVQVVPPLSYFNAVRENEIEKNGKFDPFNFTHLTPAEVKQRRLRNKGIPMMKLFETVKDIKNNPTATKFEFLHEINAKVNIVHAIDFAILNEAYRRTFESMKESGFDIGEYGTVSIHDAIGAHPEFSSVYEKHYRESARDINIVYDIQNQLAQTYASLNNANAENVKKHLDATEERMALKQKALEDMKFDSKKVFGFAPLGDVVVNRDAKSNIDTEVEAVKQQEEEADFEANEMSNENITKPEAKRAYEGIDKLWKDPKSTWAVIDVETTGKNADGTDVVGKGVQPSMVAEINITQMNGSERGDSKTYYLDVSKIGFSNKTKKFFVKNKIPDIGGHMATKFDEQGIDTNAEVMQLIQEALKGRKIVAYNSNFDVESLRKSYAKHSKKGRINFANFDAYGSVSHVNENTALKLEQAYGNIEGAPSWDTNLAHTAEYDVARTIDVIESIYTDKVGDVTTDTTGAVIKDSIKDIVNTLATKSQTIKDFVAKFDTTRVIWGKSSSYSPSQHTIELKNDANQSPENIKRALEHEINHFYTLGYLKSQTDTEGNPHKDTDADIKYVYDSLNDLINNKEEVLNNLTDERAKVVLDYFTGKNSNYENAAELIAIAKTEPATMRAIEKALPGNKTLGARLRRLIKKIANFIKTYKFNAEDMLNAVDNIETKGKAFNEDQDIAKKNRKEASVLLRKSNKTDKVGAPAKKEPKTQSALNKMLDYNKDKTEAEVITDPLSMWAREANDWAANILWNEFGPKVFDFIEPTWESADKWLQENSELYEGTRKKFLDVWSGSNMQQIKGYLVPSLIIDRLKLREFGVLWQKITKEKGKLTSTEVDRIDSQMKNMSKDEIKDLNSIFARVPIVDLMDSDAMLHAISTGSKTINELISEREKIADADYIRIAKELSGLYIDGTYSEYYNAESTGSSAAGIRMMKQLAALYSLKKIKNSEQTLVNLRTSKKKLFSDLSNRAQALSVMNKKMYDRNEDRPLHRGNKTLEYYNNPIQTLVVSKDDMHKKEYQSSDWKVAVEADPFHGHTVIYREVDGLSFEEGFGVNVDYGNTDANMPADFIPKNKNEMTNLILVPNGKKHNTYKIAIPYEKKVEMGLLENPAHSLVRSYAHANEVTQSQAIRDEIVSNTDVRKHIPTAAKIHQQEVLKLLDGDKVDGPMFIGLGADVSLTDLDPKIQHRYQTITTKLSGINGFSSKISLVRNDVAPYMVGYERTLPFKDIPELRQAFNVAAQAISMMKIHMIIINPAKVTLDAVSTTTLLMSNGVSPIEIARGWKRNIPLLTDYAKTNGQYIQQSLMASGGDENAKKKMKFLEHKLKNHKLAGAMNAGVMQSLSTDILIRDFDTITGLQRNIEKITNKMTMNKSGDLNMFGTALMAFANAGINVEDVLDKIASIAEDKEAFEGIVDEIKIMGDRVRKMKSNKEAGKYLAEYFGSPASNMTRIGSIATMYPDVMSRIIYRDFLIKNWAAEEKVDADENLKKKKITQTEYNQIMSAAKRVKSEADMTDKDIARLNAKVSDFMPDYMFAPPMIIDMGGRWFITPFVSFTARIQRTILHLAKRNPLTLLAPSIILAEMGVDVTHTPYHVIGANYLTRDEYLNNVLDDLFSWNTILPLNALNFDVIR